jgi:hypothetical protein
MPGSRARRGRRRRGRTEEEEEEEGENGRPTKIGLISNRQPSTWSGLAARHHSMEEAKEGKQGEQTRRREGGRKGREGKERSLGRPRLLRVGRRY